MAVSEDDDRARFGPYRIIHRIGTGGMGSVFEAEDTGLGHRVALKLLHPHVAARVGATRRFLREGRAAARIRHPHVVQVFALGTEGDTPYLAMELLEGGSLSDLILRKGALGLRDALDLVLPVIAGVAAAHDAGVIHRDLKPSNVCFAQRPGARPWPKVVDFSVSKVISTAGGANELTATDTVVGTAAYMAPEQARVASNASFRSDQYSLAVMLYQCITGELPFGGRSLYEILESVMSAPVAPPSARAPNIPGTIDEAVLRAMSRSPEDRFPSVRAFAAALLHAASESARAAYGTELLGESSMDTDGAIVKDIADAGSGHVPLVRTATRDGDSTAPTESRPRPKARAPTRYAGWLAVGSLFIVASLAMRLADVSHVESASRAEKASIVPTVEAVLPGLPERTERTAAPDPRNSPPAPEEPTQHTSNTSPAAGSASAARSTASPTRLERHRPAVVVSYGDNGAAILP
jgi:serine/threonine-protein kinase